MATDKPSLSDEVRSYIERKDKGMDGLLLDEVQNKIEDNKVQLRRRLTNNPDLDARLISSGFFGHADRQHIREIGGIENHRHDQAIRLVDVLQDGTNANVHALWKILKVYMNKPHVAKLFEINGQPPLDNDDELSEDYRKHLAVKQHDLKLLPMNSGDFFAYLSKEKVVSSVDIDCYIKGTRKMTQNDLILETLLKGTNQKLVDFVSAVEAVGQPFIFNEFMRPKEMNPGEDIVDNNNGILQAQVQQEEYMDEDGNIDLR